MTQLFECGDFTLASGKKSDFKIHIEGLGNVNVEALAEKIAKSFQFRLAVGVPKGGSYFAHCLNMRATKGAKVVLLVDDVYTTGGSICDLRQTLHFSKDVDVYGVVIFARNAVNEENGKWIRALFTCHPWLGVS
jgi:orotate phosphoribosyltransferase